MAKGFFSLRVCSKFFISKGRLNFAFFSQTRIWKWRVSSEQFDYGCEKVKFLYFNLGETFLIQYLGFRKFERLIVIKEGKKSRKNPYQRAFHLIELINGKEWLSTKHRAS